MLPSTPFVTNPLPDFVPIVSFTGNGSSFGVDFTGTVQIVSGYGGCRNDIVSAKLAVVDERMSTLIEGPTVYIDRRAKICGAPRSKKKELQDSTEVQNMVLTYPYNISYAEPGKVYTAGFWIVDNTDDVIALSWTDVVLTQLGPIVTVLPGDLINLGNIKQYKNEVDENHNLYVRVGYLYFPSSGPVPSAVFPAGTGTVELGSGSGKDRATAQVVIKAGKGFTGDHAASMPTVYEGPVSEEATRDTDKPFAFSASYNDVAPLNPNWIYTVFVKLTLHPKTDDTIRVRWDNVVFRAA
jgi:hypothetical protein